MYVCLRESEEMKSSTNSEGYKDQETIAIKEEQ